MAGTRKRKPPSHSITYGKRGRESSRYQNTGSSGSRRRQHREETQHDQESGSESEEHDGKKRRFVFTYSLITRQNNEEISHSTCKRYQAIQSRNGPLRLKSAPVFSIFLSCSNLGHNIVLIAIINSLLLYPTFLSFYVAKL
jgi:hypothetical protein